MVKEISLHSYQLKAFLSEKPIVSLIAGKQGGKSYLGALALRKAVSKSTDIDDCFILGAPNYKTLEQSTLPAFRKVFSGLGEEFLQKRQFILNSGKIIYIRSLDDPNALEGITNCRYIWVDEAGNISYLAFVNVLGRAAFRQAQILLTTTPYNLGWLFKELYKPWKAGKRPDVDIIQFRSIDNPFFPQAEYERLKTILDERLFAMHFMGQFQKMSGLVFQDFGINNMIGPDIMIEINQPKRWKILAGVDSGYNHPFAVIVRAISLTAKKDVQLAEHKESHCNTADKIRIMKDLQRKYNIEQFIVDCEDPALISDMNASNLKASAVSKFPGSLVAQISKHNEIIKSGEYLVLEDKNPYTLDEYETYHYPEDKKEVISENPVDANNHCMAANFYLTWETEYIRKSRNNTFKVFIDSSPKIRYQAKTPTPINEYQPVDNYDYSGVN
jgi:PBSX family phage terminase large subunit